MGNTLVKNKQLNYLVTFVLVLMLSLSLAACGSTSGDGAADTTNDPKKIPAIQTNYEISGYGLITTSVFHYGTFIQIDAVTLTGGDFYFNDLLGRIEFTSTAINGISVNGETVTITADGSVSDVNGTFAGLFELTITDGDTDTFSVDITDSGGNNVYSLSPHPIDMTTGNFTISKL